jgi:hypothetical protein
MKGRSPTGARSAWRLLETSPHGGRVRARRVPSAQPMSHSRSAECRSDSIGRGRRRTGRARNGADEHEVRCRHVRRQGNCDCSHPPRTSDAPSSREPEGCAGEVQGGIVEPRLDLVRLWAPATADRVPERVGEGDQVIEHECQSRQPASGSSRGLADADPTFEGSGRRDYGALISDTPRHRRSTAAVRCASFAAGMVASMPVPSDSSRPDAGEPLTCLQPRARRVRTRGSRSARAMAP